MLTNERLKEMLTTRTGTEFETMARELLTLHEATAPQMAEVDALENKIIYRVQAKEVYTLVCLARTAILANAQEKQRADEAEKKVQKLTDENWKLRSTLTAERSHARNLQSQIATLTAERDEARSLNQNLHDQRADAYGLRDRAIASRDEVRGLLSHILSCIITVKQDNTSEWMEYIVEEVNKVNEAIDDPDRVELCRGGIVIVEGNHAD